MKTLSLFALLIVSTLTASAADYKSCTPDQEVCALVTSEKAFTTKDEGKFEVQLLSTSHVELKGIDLWMQMGNHGHGSRPLLISQLKEDQFLVSKAYFVMKGVWQIRVSILIHGQDHKILIPISISE